MAEKAEITGPTGPHYYGGTIKSLSEVLDLYPHIKITSVIQIEKPGNTMEGDLLEVPSSVKYMLNERHIDDETGEVVGITRIIATTAEGLTHREMHTVMRSYMLNQLYVTDFGPTHCDASTKCPYVKSDDDWYRTEYVGMWRRRLVPTTDHLTSAKG